LSVGATTRRRSTFTVNSHDDDDSRGSEIASTCTSIESSGLHIADNLEESGEPVTSEIDYFGEIQVIGKGFSCDQKGRVVIPQISSTHHSLSDAGRSTLSRLQPIERKRTDMNTAQTLDFASTSRSDEDHLDEGDRAPDCEIISKLDIKANATLDAQLESIRTYPLGYNGHGPVVTLPGLEFTLDSYKYADDHMSGAKIKSGSNIRVLNNPATFGPKSYSNPDTGDLLSTPDNRLRYFDAYRRYLNVSFELEAADDIKESQREREALGSALEYKSCIMMPTLVTRRSIGCRHAGVDFKSGHAPNEEASGKSALSATDARGAFLMSPEAVRLE
jgi:hypothetical protein